MFVGLDDLPDKDLQALFLSFFISPPLPFLGEGLEKLWGDEGTRGGKKRREAPGTGLGGWGGRGVDSAAGGGSRGSRFTHSAAFLSAGVPVPALFPHPQHTELPGKHCRRRKARTVFSDSQLSGLEKRFEIQRYLSTPERVELATALSLSETQVGPRGAVLISAALSSPLKSYHLCTQCRALEWE